MINWKTAIGISLFIISGIEFLTIKDNYNSGSPSLVTIIGIAFTATIVAGCLLLIQGIRRQGVE